MPVQHSAQLRGCGALAGRHAAASSQASTTWAGNGNIIEYYECKRDQGMAIYFLRPLAALAPTATATAESAAAHVAAAGRRHTAPTRITALTKAKAGAEFLLRIQQADGDLSASVFSFDAAKAEAEPVRSANYAGLVCAILL